MDDMPGISLFQGANINVETAIPNQEEDEDFEEQKRRQKEIQNLLTNQMDEFNFDESSSANISLCEGDPNEYLQKYREANMDNQLKVLYDVRVKEVETLREQLRHLDTEFSQYKNNSKRQALLLEAEKDQMSISYKQSQDILLNKTEEIRNLQILIDKLNGEITKLHENVKSMNSDNRAYRSANQELLQKINIMEEGLTTNKLTDKQLFEDKQSELLKLHSSLDTALAKLDYKEKQCKNLEDTLKEVVRDKDDLLVEKSSIINKLTMHLENAQSQSKELLEVVEKLSLENQHLKKLAANKSTDESSTLLGMIEKSELINELQKQVTKNQQACATKTNEFERLKTKFDDLELQLDTKTKELEECMKSMNLLLKNNDQLEKDLDCQVEQIKLLRQKMDDLTYIQLEKDAFEKRVRELEKVLMEIKDKSVHEAGMQVSCILPDNDELEKMEKELNMAYNQIDSLNMKLSEAHDQIGSLSAQITLAQERDKLLKDLQAKAEHFESLIKEKQHQPESSNKSTNTDKTPDHSEVLQTKYEADLLEKEIEIRRSIKKEFDEKLTDMQNKWMKPVKENEDCAECKKLTQKLIEFGLKFNQVQMEYNKCKSQRQDDREAVAKLMEVWKQRFVVVEMQNKEMTQKYVKVKTYCEDLVKELKKREEEERKLLDMIKSEAEVAVKYWNEQALTHVIVSAKANQKHIVDTKNKFDEYSLQKEREIEAIEKEFQRKKKRTIDNKIRYHLRS